MGPRVSSELGKVKTVRKMGGTKLYRRRYRVALNSHLHTPPLGNEVIQYGIGSLYPETGWGSIHTHCKLPELLSWREHLTKAMICEARYTCTAPFSSNSITLTSYIGRLSEFHASILCLFKSTIVNLILGHLSAITLHDGPPT